MTKGEAKAAALRWLDEATVGGREADGDELADYKNRMDTLLNGALRQLAAQFPPQAVWETDAAPQITLPEDFAAAEAVFCRAADGSWRECADARRVGQRTLLTAENGGTLRIYYERLPQSVAPDDEDDTALDVAPGAEDLLALRLAADVTAGMEDKSAVHARLALRFREAASERLTQRDHRRIRIETRYEGLV